MTVSTDLAHLSGLNPILGKRTPNHAKDEKQQRVFILDVDDVSAAEGCRRKDVQQGFPEHRVSVGRQIIAIPALAGGRSAGPNVSMRGSGTPRVLNPDCMLDGLALGQG